MKKILIALDYNSAAKNIAEMGHAIAKAMNADLTIAHVITEPEYYAMQYASGLKFGLSHITNLVENVEDVKQQANDFLKSIVLNLNDHTIHTILLYGEVDESILSYGEEQKVDLIVIGSHRHSGINRFLHADLAENILLQSKVPLLTIPTGDELSLTL